MLPPMCPGDPVLRPTTGGVLAALFLALFLAACQAAGEPPSARLYQDYPETEVRHIGDTYGDSGTGDYGYVALQNGFAYLERRGVHKAAIREVSIEAIRRIGIRAPLKMLLFRASSI